MNLDFLTPVKESVVAHLELQSDLSLGQKITIHSEKTTFLL